MRLGYALHLTRGNIRGKGEGRPPLDRRADLLQNGLGSAALKSRNLRASLEVINSESIELSVDGHLMKGGWAATYAIGDIVGGRESPCPLNDP